MFDDNKFSELNPDLISTDPLKFTDTKKYTDRLKEAKKQTGLKDAITTASGKVNNKKILANLIHF